MSRRLRQYRRHMRADTSETFEAILHAHRLTKNAGRCYDSMMDIALNKYTPASKPIDPEKAQRLAAALHRAKRA